MIGGRRCDLAAKRRRIWFPIYTACRKDTLGLDSGGNHFLSPAPHLSYQSIKSVVVDGLILTSANYSLQELPAKPRLERLLLSDVGVCKLCANSHKLASTGCNQDAFCGPGKDKLNNSSHIS